ncbi:MAG: hypothetical protein ABSC08_20580, partial [Bryobacteraceae bacterium]
EFSITGPAKPVRAGELDRQDAGRLAVAGRERQEDSALLQSDRGGVTMRYKDARTLRLKPACNGRKGLHNRGIPIQSRACAGG